MLDVPIFNPAVSPEERETLNGVWNCLHTLDGLLGEMAAALDIFDTAENNIQAGNDPGDLDFQDAVRRRARLNWRFQPWMQIAARNFAMTIYEHYRVSQILQGLAAESPWMTKRIHRVKLKEGNKLFDQYFPNYAARRQAVAHFGEHRADPKNHKKHSLASPSSAGSISMSECLSGRAYIYTLNGELVTLEISQVTISKMAAVTNLKFDAFRHLAK